MLELIDKLTRFTVVHLNDNKVSQVNSGSKGLTFIKDGSPFRIKQEGNKTCLFAINVLVGELIITYEADDLIVATVGDSIEITFE